MKGVPSITSTDKSVCATLILPYPLMLIHARTSVAQTLLSVLLQGAAADVANERNAPAGQRTFSVAREGALGNPSPALGAGLGGGAACAAAEAAATKLALPEHFGVAASAATKLGRIRFPRAQRGATFVERAFARGGRDSGSKLEMAV